MQNNKQKQTLTSRQQEVLSLVQKGLTNSEICRILNISENTVKVHLANIFKILEVTNRTEAVFAIPSSESNTHAQGKNVNVVFEPDSNLKDYPLAYSLYLSVVEGIYHYHLFSIGSQENSEQQNETTYRIKVSATCNKTETIFFSLNYQNSKEILWSTQQKLEPSSDVSRIATVVTSTLFRSMSNSAAKTFEMKKDVVPQWWFVSCYSIAKMVNRNKEAFNYCEDILVPLADREEHVYATYSLVLTYYTGIVEHWVPMEKYIEKIRHYTCTAMRNSPYSIYAQFMMAIYNILIGNKVDAIAYFKQIIEVNPYDGLAQIMLAQIYLLVGQEEEALRLLDSLKSFSAQSNENPYQFTAKSFIYFLQGNYDECEKLSKQEVLIHPESPYARLFLIACNNKKGFLEESSRQICKFFEFHPNFTKADLDKLMNGISPTKKQVFTDCLKNMFS